MAEKGSMAPPVDPVRIQMGQDETQIQGEGYGVGPNSILEAGSETGLVRDQQNLSLGETWTEAQAWV